MKWIIYILYYVIEIAYLFLKDANNINAIYEVKTLNVKDFNGEYKTIRYFNHQLLKYVWDECENAFKFLQGLDNGTTTLSKLLEKSHGLTTDEHECQ